MNFLRAEPMRRHDLMHLHGNPKGSGAKILAAGQPCKIGECNEKTSENNLVAARRQTKAISSSSLRNAGTHRPRPRDLRKCPSFHFVSITTIGGYGSLRSQGRHRHRFALACSAELCAASASLAEIAA